MEIFLFEIHAPGDASVGIFDAHTVLKGPFHFEDEHDLAEAEDALRLFGEIVWGDAYVVTVDQKYLDDMKRLEELLGSGGEG